MIFTLPSMYSYYYNMDSTIAHYSAASEDKKLNCLKFYLWALQHQLRSFRMVIADHQYYQKTLEDRRGILTAPSTSFLCKTIVFENTAYNEKFEGKHYPRHIAVMVQYIGKIHTEKLNKVMRVWQQDHSLEKASKQHFHFRLADQEVSAKLTGYEHNGVIPVLMKTSMPIVFSHHIQQLKPQFLWMGGGHPEIKMRLSFADFRKAYPDSMLVDDITYE